MAARTAAEQESAHKVVSCESKIIDLAEQLRKITEENRVNKYEREQMSIKMKENQDMMDREEGLKIQKNKQI